MYGLLQTTQTPMQFNWCGKGLGTGASGNQLYDNLNISTNVYISPAGTSPSIYTNQKGTLSYTFTKSGATVGIPTTGTALSTTFFQDSYSGTVGAISNYNLTINDSNTGQQNTSLNSVRWGIV